MISFASGERKTSEMKFHLAVSFYSNASTLILVFHVEMLKQISVCLLVICCYLVVADPHFRKDKDWLKADAVKGDKPLKMWKPFGWTYWNKDGHYNKDWGKFWYWKLKN